ncbi:MAG: MOSC domain-containing protein [Actinomycetota bacterium]|nr:MOSC domain-containing protein [Actinomycetota bacterium]
MQLLSVQIATAQDIQIGSRTDKTGIFKLPVENAEIRELGLVGDAIISTRHHGGPDQAVYVYSDEDYAWWRAELGAELPPGTFGENLTFSGFGAGEVHVGDRWTMGDVVLETTAPRLPCATFAARMDDGGFVRRFRAGRRPGFYARVIVPGTVTSGLEVSKTPSSSEVTVMEVFDISYDTDASAEELRRALAAPIAIRDRVDLERRLTKFG